MNIRFTKVFLKSFKKLDFEIQRRAKLRIDLFQNNPFHNSLHSHKLTGTMCDTYSFSVTGSHRIVYYWENDTVVFVDIGTHDEVYS